MANRKRQIVLRVPVTPEERAIIQQKMAQLGTKNFSQKIGVNVNQIARRINSTGAVYAQDVEDIKGALTQIWQLQRSILSR